MKVRFQKIDVLTRRGAPVRLEWGHVLFFLSLQRSAQLTNAEAAHSKPRAYPVPHIADDGHFRQRSITDEGVEDIDMAEGMPPDVEVL